MSTVRIAAGEQFETTTPADLRALYERLDARFAEQTREGLRGIKIMRLPTSYAVAAGASTQLPPPAGGYGLIGPESGFIWRIQRVTIATNGTDGAGFVTAGTPSQPAVPASTVAQQNVNSYPVRVVVSGGTATATFVNGIQVGVGDGTFIVPSGGSISITYSLAPTWVWSNAFPSSTANLGAGYSLYTTSDESGQSKNLIDSSLQVGQGYYPASRGVFLMPGEGLLAIVNSTAPNTYTMSGQVMSVPAEMMGKLA